MIIHNFQILIPLFAIFYLLVVYLLLTVAQRSKKVMTHQSSPSINSAPTVEN